jgi:DNA-binding response OmpR family regulator
MKILIVEDEQHLADGVRFNLEAEGYEAEIVADGEAGLQRMADAEFDAVVLDVMLPGINGFDVARVLRERNDFTPILMLTARSRPDDVLRGFEAGADDYLPKPFDLAIFLARLNGLLRRSGWSRRSELEAAATGLPHMDLQNPVDPEPPEQPLTVNNRLIDLANLEIRNDGELVRLTLMEMKLLRYLVEHAGQVVSRKTILEDVWGLAEDTDTRAIDNFIVRLRKYLEDDPANPKFVRTVRGVGYRLEPDGETQRPT